MSTFDDLNKILLDRNVTETPVSQDTDLLKDLEMDSLDVMDMVMEIEDRFDIVIGQGEMSNVQTMTDLVNLVDGKLNP
jgi:acyl carrier protein